MVETCWLPLETPTSGLASGELAGLGPTNVKAAGLHTYSQGQRCGSLSVCVNTAQAKFDSLILRLSSLI